MKNFVVLLNLFKNLINNQRETFNMLIYYCSLPLLIHDMKREKNCVEIFKFKKEKAYSA